MNVFIPEKYFEIELKAKSIISWLKVPSLFPKLTINRNRKERSSQQQQKINHILQLWKIKGLPEWESEKVKYLSRIYFLLNPLSIILITDPIFASLNKDYPNYSNDFVNNCFKKCCLTFPIRQKKNLFFYIFTTLTGSLEQSIDRQRPRVSSPELNTHKVFPSISNFGIYHFFLLEYKKSWE